MDAVRVNTAHQTIPESLSILRNVRKVSSKIPFIVDTKGPEIRTSGETPNIAVRKGDKVTIITGQPVKKQRTIGVTYKGFIDVVPIGTLNGLL